MLVRRLQQIMKPLSSTSHRRVASSLPKKLFQQQILIPTLPEINHSQRLTDKLLLEESIGHSRRHSSVNSSRPVRPLSKSPENDFYGEGIRRQPRFNVLKQRMRMRVKKLSIFQAPPVIYKSEIQDLTDIQTPAPMRSSQSKQNFSPQLKQMKFVLNESKPLRKPLTHKKLPIAWCGTSKKLLSRIFQQKEYEDKFDYINKLLLKNDYLYRSKGSNVQLDQDWKY